MPVLKKEKKTKKAKQELEKALRFKPGDKFSHNNVDYDIISVCDSGLLCKPLDKKQSIAIEVFINFIAIP